MSLHPELTAFLDLVEEGRLAGRPPLHALSAVAARESFEQASAGLAWPLPQQVARRALSARTRDGATLGLRLYLPEDLPEVAGDRPWPVLLYFHGGGYVVGGLDSHDGICAELAWRTPCAVLAVDYRRAPEHRFPTALFDAEDALRWLQAEGPALGLDVSRLAVGGDSAGATLATVLAIQAARAPRDWPQIRLQLLCYPSTDASRTTVSSDLFDEGYLLESATLEWFYEQYQRTPADRLDWRFSPLLCENVQGAAPAFVGLAQYDPLHDEGVAYAEHLRRAGVSVTCRQYPATHDLLRMGAIMPGIDEVYAQLASSLAQALHN
ncbi:alpha/beta hydrolase [Pseudomonas sp. GD03860]|uniref:alpha/beta hydrolase n=1 Tax=Pseudomonas TaxID=286 RepID=UPI0023632A2D|nr:MULTISPECIES: alpha/beta hydrolase [Pseudomonas]MDD2058571.1 alpha/beta hydrolase [Pseudomonas putida]MDH0639564.1 alpha/beta hydrolase [Pseudomonas sp. GD03860]